MPNPDSDSSSSAPSPDDGAYEKWLVRILLTLAFGLAFGIEGMTLIRSFLLDSGDDEQIEAQEKRPVLREGDALMPSTAPEVRVRRLRVRATDETWTFTLTARPDTALSQPYHLSFKLTTSDGTTPDAVPSYTWAPSDTTSFDASWSLPVGRRPDALTITATTELPPHSAPSTTRTVDLGHVPVRMQ